MMGSDVDLLQGPVENFQIIKRPHMFCHPAAFRAALEMGPVRHGMAADEILDQFPFSVIEPRAGDVGQAVEARPVNRIQRIG